MGIVGRDHRPGAWTGSPDGFRRNALGRNGCALGAVPVEGACYRRERLTLSRGGSLVFFLCTGGSSAPHWGQTRAFLSSTTWPFEQVRLCFAMTGPPLVFVISIDKYTQRRISVKSAATELANRLGRSWRPFWLRPPTFKVQLLRSKVPNLEAFALP